MPDAPKGAPRKRAPLKLAIVSDIHHGDDKLTKRGSAALGLLDDFLTFAGDWGADYIVDLGDRISDVDRTTDARLLREVAARFAGLNTPHAHINGNHDVAFLGEAANADVLPGAGASRSVEIKGWRLIFWQADTYIPYPDPFSLRKSDLDWLAAELPQSDAPTIVFSHVPVSGGSMTGNYWFQNNPQHATYPNAAEARALIENLGHVALCVSGHVHWNSLNRVNAVPHIALQSLTESFATGGAAAGVWATLELDDAIRWRAHGRDPIEMTLPLRRPGESWETPLPGLRHLKRAWRSNAVLTDVEALVFDLDGVLYRDEEPVPAAREFVAWARRAGYPIAAITNNAAGSAAAYAARLARLGYDIPAERIVSAGMATAAWLAERAPGAGIHAVGPAALKAELAAAGCVEAGDAADYVVAGIDPGVTVADLAAATRLIRGGAKLIMTNPDPTHPTPDGYAPEAGAVQAFLETAGGVAATVVGKPNPYIFKLALARLGMAAGKTLMVGDTPETDIRGGAAAGMATALVETGNPTAGAAAFPPTVQVADLAELQELLAR